MEDPIGMKVVNLLVYTNGPAKFATLPIGEEQRLRRSHASALSPQSIRCLQHIHVRIQRRGAEVRSLSEKSQKYRVFSNTVTKI